MANGEFFSLPFTDCTQAGERLTLGTPPNPGCLGELFPHAVALYLLEESSFSPPGLAESSAPLPCHPSLNPQEMTAARNNFL